MEFQIKKILIYFSILISLILVYLLAINFIETNKLYPQEQDWFNLDVWIYAKNSSCVDFDNFNIYYYNDPSRIHYKGNWNSKNLVLIHGYLHKKCDFNYTKISISADNLNFPIYPIENNNTFEINRTNNTEFDIILNDTEDKYFHEIEIILPIDKKFYNYYRFNTNSLSGIGVFTFNYREGLFDGGYYANDNSFVVYGQENYEERPIKSDRYKWYNFEGDSNVLVFFNPRSKFWFLIGKMIDAIMLGLIVFILSRFPLKEIQENIKRITGKHKKPIKSGH